MLIPILTLSILRLRTTIFSCSKVIIAETYNLSLTDSAYDKTNVRSRIGQRRACLADDNLIKRHLPSTKHEFIYAMPRQTEH